MTSSILQLREMIPLYLNGSLSDEQVKAFEQGLENHPELQLELAEFSDINATFDDIEMPDDEQFAGLFNQIESNINLHTARQESFSAPHQSWLASLKDLFLNPFVSWGVALAQLAIVAILVLQNPGDDKDIRYQSLSQNTTEQEATINVVFHGSATLTQLNSLLLENELKIIATPGRGKAYLFGVKESADMDLVIKQLRQSEIVRFVEKQ